MISYVDQPFDERTSLDSLNSYVRKWFEDNFDELTPPQKYAFKLIKDKKNLIITAPTGSGKTLSAFLAILSALFEKSLKGRLEEKVYCIYVSPLRALNNDVYKNLTGPLEEIYEQIKRSKGVSMIKENIKKVTIAVRTGDTTQKERREQLLRPPNILVTTPESLAIILNSERYIENVMDLEYVVIDEIHELANNKRGVHLSLSIERLQNLLGHELVRIGMGATLHPLEEAAKFLVGYKNDTERDCAIIDASWSKRFDVTVMSPVPDMIYTDNTLIEKRMYECINRIIKKSKTTLVFTNTRSGTERVVFNLKKRFKYSENIAAHHGSLSRESRLEVEEMLKRGSLKCAVSSTSLELGMDIGSIDNVIQLGSPKSVTRAVQRIGRAGHSFKDIAKGEVIVLNRDDLVECTIMIDLARKRQLDAFTVPKNPLDVLAQHIVGMSLTKRWNVDEAYNLIRGAYAYATLPKESYIDLLNYLAGNYVGLESRKVYGKIWYDEQEKMFGRRGKMAKVIYMLNLGTIPDEVAVNVFESKTKRWIGNIEEEFLAQLKLGDIFTLGGRLYGFEYAKGMRCYVNQAQASSPTIPPWFSEQLPLSYELANSIGEFRAGFAEILQGNMKLSKRAALLRLLKVKTIPAYAKEVLGKLPIEANAKKAIFGYFVEQILFAGVVPNNNLLLIEQTKSISRDSKPKEHLIFHTLFGRRVNDALSRLFAIELGYMLGQDIAIMVSDNGFVLTPEMSSRISSSMVDELVEGVLGRDVEKTLKKNIRRTEMMKRRFRHVAARSFMILKNYKGWKMPLGKQQINAQILLKAAETIDPNFPVISETYREILNDVMDLPRTGEVLSRLKTGSMKYKFIKTPSPSPFAHTLITFGHADVILMKDRHNYLKQLHKLVLQRIKER